MRHARPQLRRSILKPPRRRGTVSDGMGEKTRLIIDHARANGGIITTREAQALGMDRSVLARMVSDGVFRRLQRGVLALPGIDSAHALDLAAACRRLEAVVSHQSAGQLHHFEGVPWSPPTITVPHRLTNRFPGVHIHQSTDISDADVVSIGSLPVTSPERTIIDLAAVMSDRRLDLVLDRALSSGIVDLTKLSEVFTGLARRGKPGTTRVRRLIEQREGRYVPADSVLESRLLQLIDASGLPLPYTQFRPAWLVPTNGRVDFAYPEHQLIIEGDSRKWHLLMKSFETDRHRDNQAQLAGWRILRFTWQDITERSDYVVSAIRTALST